MTTIITDELSVSFYDGSSFKAYPKLLGLYFVVTGCSVTFYAGIQGLYLTKAAVSDISVNGVQLDNSNYKTKLKEIF